MLEARKEYKFVFKNFELQNFLLFLNNKENKLYENRYIKSLYMDTIAFKLFHLSQNNDSNKFKVRYRQYDEKSPIFLEEKFNGSQGKFKNKTQVKSITDFNSVNEIYYKNLKLVPTLFVSYIRQYLLFNDVRITIDKRIEYSNSSFRSLGFNSYKSNLNIVEYKIHNNNSDIEKYFYKNPESFSKYDEGIKKIYNFS